MRRRRQRLAIQPLNSVNLTPMLDICFTLLLAFMIVAPSLRTGIKIDLPQVGGPPLPEKKTYTITLEPAEAGTSTRIYLMAESRPVELDYQELERELEQHYERLGQGLDLVIEADRTVQVESLLKVLRITNTIGIKNVGVLTGQEEKK